MIKLFIIEDHHIIVAGIKNIFRSKNDEIRVIGSAKNVSDAIMNLRKEVPDIIVLDLYIKKDNPVDNIQRLRNSFPSIPIVILTMEDSYSGRERCFEKGRRHISLKKIQKRQ